MKILWFTNTPCGASEKLSTESNSGGWMSALEQSVVNNPDLELGVCFYWQKQVDAFTYRNVRYYPIVRKSLIDKLYSVLGTVYMYSRDKRELGALKSVVNDFCPDLIHIHGTEDNFGLIQADVNVPVIISLQGILGPYLLKYFSGVPLSVAQKYEPFVNKLKLKSIRTRYRLAKYKSFRETEILLNAQHILGRTDWDRRIAHLLAPRAKYEVLEEMLRDPFYVNQWNKKEFGSPLKVISVITLGLYKGFETIVQAINLLDAYGFDVEWTVVGQTYSDLLPSIVKRWFQKPISDEKLRLIGSRNATELAELMLVHDIYCHVSHIENSSNSICEAMMLGMPIIATNTGGTSSLLRDGIEGLLIQDGDSYSLAGTILEMHDNTIQSIEYGNNARLKALTKHSKESIYKSTIEIYDNAINK